MGTSVEIIDPGIQSTVQDLGRWGFQEWGVPVCGTVAPDWMILGNALVGNSDEAAGVEFRLVGPTLKAMGGSIKIAVCGDVALEIRRQTPTGTQTQAMAAWRSFTLNENDELKVASLQNSTAGFIAFGGGLSVEKVMNSRATYVRSGFGGFNGRPLSRGDQIVLRGQVPERAQETDKLLPNPPVYDQKVRVVWGPQDDYFAPDALETFLHNEYQVSRASDRMGARLEGPPLGHKPDFGSEIISDGVAPGAIQVPGNGLPIVLLNDGQTVGGYPKIASVISADLPKVANALPGTALHFEVVSAKEACLIAREQDVELSRLKSSMVTASMNGFVDLNALYQANLIDGVVDMSRPDHFCAHLDD